MVAPLLRSLAITHFCDSVRLAPDSAEIKNACYFAYTLRLDLPGSNHHVIRGADFQRRALDFYSGLPVAAPLEEAYWVLALPESFQDTVAEECPALVALSYYLVAETKMYVDPSHALEYAEIGSGLLGKLDPRLLAMLTESWPLQLALDHLRRAGLAAQRPLLNAPQGLAVDLVVARCKEDLGWLQTVLPRWASACRMRLFLYEKCGGQGPGSEEVGGVPVLVVPLVDGPPGGRKDECSAYLTHLARAAWRGDAAHFTIFLQADALHHTRLQLLDFVMRAIWHGTLDVEFLHLSRARMVSSTSPCKRAIFEQVLGRRAAEVPRGYCCAQFLASRDAIIRGGSGLWERALTAMDSPLPTGCESVRPAAGMHCLVYESIWHVMFGLPERLSPRAEDITLPLFLRAPEVDASDLPGGADSPMYFKLAAGSEADVSWMDEVEQGIDITGARSIGYSSAAPLEVPSSGAQYVRTREGA